MVSRSLPRTVGGLVKGTVASHLLDNGGSVAERVRLTRKTCPRISVHVQPDPGLSTRKLSKRLLPSNFRRNWGRTTTTTRASWFRVTRTVALSRPPAVDMSGVDGGAAKRRRLRHERQTVAMELAAALHPSLDGERETY